MAEKTRVHLRLGLISYDAKGKNVTRPHLQNTICLELMEQAVLPYAVEGFHEIKKDSMDGFSTLTGTAPFINDVDQLLDCRLAGEKSKLMVAI